MIGIKTAWLQVKEEIRAKAYAEGLAEGRAEVRAEAYAEGYAEGRAAVYAELKAKTLSEIAAELGIDESPGANGNYPPSPDHATSHPENTCQPRCRHND